MPNFKRRNKHASTIGIGSAINTGGRLRYVHSLRREGEHTFALIAASGHVPHTEIRLSGYYSVYPSMATLTQRFLEDNVHDGEIAYESEEWEFNVWSNNLEEMAADIRREFLSFEATGAGYAGDPDGSQIVDFFTGEREIRTMFPRGLHTAELSRLIEMVNG